MTQLQDDYYASIPQEKNDDWNTLITQKKIWIKKKLKVKAKKAQDEIIVSQTQDEIIISHWISETSSQISEHKENPSDKVSSAWETESLNEKLESWKKSTFQVISRSKPKNLSIQKVEYTPNVSNTEVDESEKDIERKDTPVVKFKAWFWSIDKKKSFGKDTIRNSDDETSKAKKPKPFSLNRKKGTALLEDSDVWFRRSGKGKTKKKQEKNIEDIEQNLKNKTWETIQIDDILSLKEFSEKIWVPLSKLIAEFMKNGMMVNLNSQIDFDTASLIAESFEVTLEKKGSSDVSIQDVILGNIKELIAEDDTSKLSEKPPVVSIMWHVDHGKTSLLDYIRSAKIADGEAGGITQSIGAYQIQHNGKKISFLDTPGHEAFTIMRSRWARSTDIAVLVVAADEGVKPQTLESISHAREANIPIIVAINKMDKESANPDYVKGQLAEKWLTAEDWGWDVPMVPVSALTWFWVDDLIEMILLVTEIQNLKANPDRLAVGTIIESHLDINLWPVATVLLNTWTLSKGDNIVSGWSYGKVKVMKDYLGTSILKAFPWDPVLLVGLNEVAIWGDILQGVEDFEVARLKAFQFLEYQASQKKAKNTQLDILMSRIHSGNLKHLKIVLKADTNGSLEAIKNALLKLSTPETSVMIIHSGVGNITQWDVLMCWGSSALLVGFWVQVGPNAKNELESTKVEFIESKVIYHITDRVEKIVSGMLDPKEVEVILAHAKIGGIFYDSKSFKVLGLIGIKEGESIENTALIRILRDGKLIGKGKILSLKQWVEEVKKLEWPAECGIKVSWLPEVFEKDSVEVYKITIEK